MKEFTEIIRDRRGGKGWIMEMAESPTTYRVSGNENYLFLMLQDITIDLHCLQEYLT